MANFASVRVGAPFHPESTNDESPLSQNTTQHFFRYLIPLSACFVRSGRLGGRWGYANKGPLQRD